MSRCLVAIPVFNELQHLESVLCEVSRYASDVVVIDDGSTDGTTELLRGLDAVTKLHHPENRGYGQALLSAFGYAERAGYEWVVTIDCDQQHEPASIPRFMDVAYNSEFDIISGSRYLEHLDPHGDPPLDRRRINGTITRILNDMLGTSLTDSFCGFKAYRVSALQRLHVDIPGYAMPLQLWVQAVHHELSITEIPIRLIYNDPNRHFGGMLDEPDLRLAHYLEVLVQELVRVRVETAVGDGRPRGCL
jgi:dolichol-phosphate mannosyltransferase